METRRRLNWETGSWSKCEWKRLYLEDVEGFELDVPAVVSQQVHHQLQVLGFTDVFSHDGEIVSVQEKFPKELNGDKETDGDSVIGVASVNSDRSPPPPWSGPLPLKTAVW